MDDYLAGEPPRSVHVQIADIVLRPEWQVRTELNHRVIRDYATATIHGTLPPILLGHVNGALMLVDGWHRLEAAKRLKRETIMAVVQNMTENYAKWAAAEANTTHGLPLRFREKREVFRRYVDTKQHRDGRKFKSYRDIARELHGLAGKSTLQRWMADDFPSIAAKMATGRPAETAAPPTDNATPYFRQACAHVEQIVAAAPAMHEGERRQLVEQLNEAVSKILTAAPWTEPEQMEEL
jgi:hypothetical protein